MNREKAYELGCFLIYATSRQEAIERLRHYMVTKLNNEYKFKKRKEIIKK